MMERRLRDRIVQSFIEGLAFDDVNPEGIYRLHSYLQLIVPEKGEGLHSGSITWYEL